MDAAAELRTPARETAGDGRFEARVVGMHCAGCVASIEKAVTGLPGVESAEVSLLTGDISVRLSRAVSLDAALTSDIAGAVASAGPYKLERAPEAAAEILEGAGEHEHHAHGGGGFLPVATALALSAASMAVSMSGFGGTAAGRWTAFLLATPVCVLFGWSFLLALGSSLRNRTFGMDSLIGLGAGTAYASSVVTLVGAAGGPLFFDTAAIIVAIVRLGRWIEDRARGRASDALGELLAFAPDRARVVRRGTEHMVPVAEVQPGERVRVRPGERVPLDGRIVHGGAAMDESLVSGESVPVERTAPDPVVAGAMNLTGAVEIKVTRGASESTISRIAAAVGKAQMEKIPLQRAADRVAGVLVPAVMVVAAATVAAWLLAGGSADFALARGVAVLVVACPCAIGLAAPIAVLVATGRSARRGILFRSGGALEALASVRAVGLDKTGTVTTGEPVVVALEPAPGTSAAALLRFAASAEQGSEHPLGKAVVAHAKEEGVPLQAPERFEALPGRGVTARFDGGGSTVWVGSARLVRERRLAVPETAGAAGASGWLRVIRESAGRTEFIGSIGFRDRPRPEAAELVRRLEEDGLAVSLVSGDETAAVTATGAEVGVQDVEGGLLPEQKLAAVDRLRERHGPVAMVGDGINDAPALARADAGIAFAEGTEIAREAAAVTLMRPDLRLVSEALRIARRALRTIRQNLFWAFFYNVAALPLAAGALYPATGLLLPPEAAAAAMALSSLSVVGNALRLRRDA
ncbi:MAG: cation-translocating P-type ATPase [Acidobacteria bacterium]|nr:cation-translocating P-type ATPase [Acidobacteriota bacterium]